MSKANTSLFDWNFMLAHLGRKKQDTPRPPKTVLNEINKNMHIFFRPEYFKKSIHPMGDNMIQAWETNIRRLAV